MNTEKILLEGIPASAGVVTGIARIVSGIEDQDRFHDGDILVTRITDPTMVAMMNRAAGIVCDIGSITSHPSIVARELGIPCVVNAGNATTILNNGQRITINGTEGTIYAV